MDPVFQKSVPCYPWKDPRLMRLPGIQPLDAGDWLRVDDAYAGQMRLRDHLIETVPDRVHALLPDAARAATELYQRVLGELPGLGFHISGSHAQRPDGVTILLDPAKPMLTLGRLCQEDFCIMQAEPGGEPVLTAAILCFPAGWTLSEKLGRAMIRIHKPVPGYDEDAARRVQRLFDAIRPEQPLWRANAHCSSANLFNPRTEESGHLPGGDLPYLRSERQCLLRLPESRAVIFSIHTYLVRRDDLPEDVRRELADHPIRGAA